MKTIGLLGGMSWESTLTYYRIINETVKSRCGGLTSAEICLYSVNFQEIEPLIQAGDWKEIAARLCDYASRIEQAGADFLLICTNTMHKVADDIQKNLNIPLLHIVDATAREILSQGIKRVGLIGTGPTMEDDFYKGRLSRNFGLEVLVPEAQDRRIIHDVIFNELCLGILNETSRKAYLRIMNTLIENKAEAIILGCTEIALLVNPTHTRIHLFDTTRIHAEKAAEAAITP